MQDNLKVPCTKQKNNEADYLVGIRNPQYFS